MADSVSMVPHMVSIIEMVKGQIVQTHQNYVGVKRTIRNLSQYQTADAAPGHYLKYREKVQKSMKLKYSDWMMCLHSENIRAKLLEKLLMQTGTM